MSIAKDTNGKTIKVGDVVSFWQGDEAPKRGYGKVIDIIDSRLGFPVLVVEVNAGVREDGDHLEIKSGTVDVFALDCTFATRLR
jgi:hypothetical protein